MMNWATCSDGHAHWGRLGAAGLLLAGDGAVLLQLRAKWAHRGGTWSVPGGAVERGETFEQAALREAEEELGLAGDRVDVRGTWTALCGGWRYETVLAHPVGGVRQVRVRDRAESEGHRWVGVDEVDGLDLHPAFRAAWQHDDGVLRGFASATARA